MATITPRLISSRFISNPDDSTQGVKLKVIDGISFIDKRRRNQEAQFRLINDPTAGRRVKVVNVGDLSTSTTGDRLLVERILNFSVVDRRSRAQESQFALINAADPLVHYRTHKTKVYATDANGNKDTDTWVEVQRIDQIWVRDLRNRGQDSIFTLAWKDVDDPEWDYTDVPEPTRDWDGTTINPPWRLDPFQNIVDASWGGAGYFFVLYESNKVAAIPMSRLDGVTGASGSSLSATGGTGPDFTPTYTATLEQSFWGPTGSMGNDWLNLRINALQFLFGATGVSGATGVASVSAILSTISLTGATGGTGATGATGSTKLVRSDNFYLTNRFLSSFLDSHCVGQVAITAQPEDFRSHENPLMALGADNILRTPARKFTVTNTKTFTDAGENALATDNVPTGVINMPFAIGPDGWYYPYVFAGVANITWGYWWLYAGIEGPNYLQIPKTINPRPSSLPMNRVVYAKTPDNQVTIFGHDDEEGSRTSSGDFPIAIYEKSGGTDRIKIETIPISFTTDFGEGSETISASLNGLDWSYTWPGTDYNSGNLNSRITNFPPNMSKDGWYVAQYTYAFILGDDYFGDPPTYRVKTPYGEFSRTGIPNVTEDLLHPWLHLSNGKHVIQGFGVNLGFPKRYYRELSESGIVSTTFNLADPEHEEIKLYCDGVEIGARLAAALGTELKKIRTALINIPLARIKSLG